MNESLYNIEMKNIEFFLRKKLDILNCRIIKYKTRGFKAVVPLDYYLLENSLIEYDNKSFKQCPSVFAFKEGEEKNEDEMTIRLKLLEKKQIEMEKVSLVYSYLILS
jgi:hypothetical protein